MTICQSAIKTPTRLLCVNLARAAAVWLLLLAFAVLSVGAQAQQRPTTYAINVDWSGIFVGGHVGYAVVDLDSVFDSSSIDRPRKLEDATLGRDFDAEGVFGGINFGWNAQNGIFVWGIEGDVSYFGLSERAFDPEDEGTNGGETDNAMVDVEWIASLRGRVGIAAARSLFFATAGIAWVDATYTAQNRDNSAGDQGSVSLSGPGFVVGGGIEHAVSDHLSLKFEGLFYTFDQRKDASGLTTDSDQGDFAKLKDIVVVRLGATYSLAPRRNNVASSRDPTTSALWQGFYVGANGGYSLVSFDSIFDANEISNPFDNEDSVLGRFFDLDGGVFGGHIGYNVMIGRYLVGFEADWAQLNGSDLRFDPNGGDPDDDSASAELDWIASLRARLGITSARSVLYATAGVAWVGGKYTASDGDCFCGPTVGSVSLDQRGFVFGGGIEHAITDQLLFRFEALHYVFGHTFDTRNLTPDSDVGDFAKLKDISAARIGVSYKFNSN